MLIIATELAVVVESREDYNSVDKTGHLSPHLGSRSVINLKWSDIACLATYKLMY